jgi:hypothetical protein
MGIEKTTAPLDAETSVAGRDFLAFERIFILILATEYWTRAAALWSGLDPASSAYVALAGVFCALAWNRTTRRAGFAGLAALQLLVLYRDFPQAGNHAYLELIVCSLLAVLDPSLEGERQLLVRAVRWIVCVVLFWSGVQKLVHGYYFHGEQLAHSLQIESFRPVLALLLPADELARLSAYTGAVGDGPYTVASPLFVLSSNAVYIAEIGLAALLLLPGTRAAATIGALLFLAAVEFAAREVFFGLLFADALLMFRDGGVHPRLVGVFAGLLLCLILSRLGVLPAAVFY